MSDEKLLRCPCCGRKAELRHEDGFVYVVCANDGCYIRTDGCLNENEAIKVWNTRKPMERIVEKLQKELELADKEKKLLVQENPLQFDSARGYATGIYNAIEIVKEVSG